MNEHTISEDPARSLSAEKSSSFGTQVVSDSSLLGESKTWHDEDQRLRLKTNV